jgi:hypothetical protein
MHFAFAKIPTKHLNFLKKCILCIKIRDSCFE